MQKYIYYGWVNEKEFKYSVSKFPIIEEQTYTGIKTYLVDNYLVVGDHNSTRYIEEDYHMNKELRFRTNCVGFMSLDNKKVLEWVKKQKMQKETRLLNDLEKIQEAKIDNCGELVYI